MTARPSSPTPMTPAIWPSIAMPAAVPVPSFAAHSAMVSQTERTWRSGSSSTAPGAGRFRSEGRKLSARNRPSAS